MEPVCQGRASTRRTLGRALVATDHISLEVVAERLRRENPSRSAGIRHLPSGADHILGAAGKEPQVVDRFGLRKDGYCVSVGRPVPEKGFADVIDAHKASGVEYPLVFVGANANKKHGRELLAFADSNVVMTGSQPMECVAELVGSDRLFILASHHEGLPIAALEAIALGARVLLSDIPANLGIGLPKEHYFPVGDVSALSGRLCDDAFNFPAVGLSSRFRWQGIAEDTSTLYDELT